MLEQRRRIGRNCVFLPVGLDEQVDIDNEEDFVFAQRLLASSAVGPMAATTLPRPHELAMIELVPTREEVKMVAFDLDGVLLDTKENMRRAWECTAREFGYDVPFEAYFREIGKPFADILTALGIQDRHGRMAEVYASASLKYADNVALVDGATEALKRIKQAGLKTAIVTSKDRERTEYMIESFRRYVDHIVCPEERLRGKPAPDQILAACVSANVDPADVLYVGDMAVDHECARRAGVAYAHAAWGYGEPVDRQAVWFAEVADLAAFLVDT